MERNVISEINNGLQTALVDSDIDSNLAYRPQFITNDHKRGIKVLTHIKIEQKVEREQVAQATGTNKDDSAVKAPKKRKTKKIQPNDPCPCGSGKKYKRCHGR